MNYIAHATAGAGVALAITKVVSVDFKSQVIVYSSCILGSLLPDIDHPKAIISKYIPIIPGLLYDTVGHRTLTHSLLFTLIIGLICSYFNLLLGIGLSLGILSHILLDLPGPYGVAFLYPFKKERIKIKA